MKIEKASIMNLPMENSACRNVLPLSCGSSVDTWCELGANGFMG